MRDTISKLSDIRSKYNCFDETDEPYYRALSDAIRLLSQRADGDTISRQAAIDALEKVAELFPWRVPGNRDTYDRYNEAWNDAIGRAEIEIEELPSAQTEIIRCKDCKWKQGSECVRFAEVRPFPNDFCSRAERREE